MLGLLRLDSIGEDSTRHSVGSQIYKSVNKPRFLSSNTRTNRFFSEPNMTSAVKTHTQIFSQAYSSGQHMPAIPLTKAHSYSGVSEPRTDYCSLSKKLISSPFDFSIEELVPINILQCLTTVNMENSMLTAAESGVDTISGEGPKLSLNTNPSIFSVDLSVFTQPQWSSNSDVPFQFKLAMADNTKQDNINSTNAFDKDNSNTEVLESVKSSSLSESNTESNCSNFNVTGSENVTDKSSSSCERLSNMSIDSNLSGQVSSNNVAENCKREVVSTVDDSRSQCTIKSINNLALILSSPRKNVKKGRPSSKKQKKRQREKRKRGSPPVLTNVICSPSKSRNGAEQCNSDSVRLEFLSNPSDELDNSSISSWTSPPNSQNTCEKVSSSAKAPTKYCSVAHLFFRSNSNSQEVDDEDYDYNESSEWSKIEHKGICTSPIKGFGFNFALNLDSIFKQKSIPSLKNVLGGRRVKENGTDLAPSASASCTNSRSFSQSLSDDDSFEDSGIEFCASPTTSEFTSCSFATGLSLDILFPNRSSCKSQNAESWSETAVDLVDGLPSCDNNSHETDLETINRINDKWNENYPSAGFRSCHSVSTDEIKDQSIKVHFAAEPHLVTVHVVGTEERGGTWHHFALDRERFEKRIMELEKIISPVLEAGYRAKILQRRQRLDEEQ